MLYGGALCYSLPFIKSSDSSVLTKTAKSIIRKHHKCRCIAERNAQNENTTLRHNRLRHDGA